MKRRLLAAMMLLCYAVDCFARILVVMPRFSGDVADANDLQHAQVHRATVLGVLNAFGVDYDVVTSSVGKTEFCRLGTVTYNFGEAGAYTRSYDAVIHVCPGAFINTGYRPDSLFSSTKLPKVPQLMVAMSYSTFSAACACSVGVTGSGAGYNTLTNYIGWTAYYNGVVPLRYRSGTLDGLALGSVSGGTTVNRRKGTVRGVIFAGSNTAHAQTVLPTVPLPCIDCDSLLEAQAPQGQDSCGLVVEQNDFAGALVSGFDPVTVRPKPIILCDIAHNSNAQLDASMMMLSLAMLDSICGGTVIKKPVSFGINIRGGFRRNNQSVMGGIAPRDSVALKASIDSISTLGVPFTVGVNIDSVASYPEEKFWWARAGNLVRYAPEPWAGCSDSSKVSGNPRAGISSAVDVFGMFRKRAAYGDSATHAIDGADTSVYWLLKRAFFRTDSAFAGRLDRVAIPPLGDWSPANFAQSGHDSLRWAIQQAGARALVIVPARANNPAPVPGNPVGFPGFAQGSQFTSLANNNTPVRLLATQAFPDSGSALVEGGFSTDSYVTGTSSWGRSGESFWSTFLLGLQNGNGGYLLVSQPATPLEGRISVFTLNASDLGAGTRADFATRPTHPGWYSIKWVANAARIANMIAGRAIVNIVPLEQLTP